MEATEKGWTNGDGGLKWGDIYGMIDAVRKIAFREGIGNIMADGANATAKHFGHPEVGHDGQGPGHPGLRSARHEGHGPGLCHQQPRRVPPARVRRRPPN